MSLSPAEYTGFSVLDILTGLDCRDFTARDVAKAAIATIESLEAEHVGAFISLTPEMALKAAGNVDGTCVSGASPFEAGLLAGVPIGYKDNMNLLGSRTTCASRMMENYESMVNATCVSKTLAAGALPMGKTNLDEFAFGSSTETSAFKTTHNPWDLTRVPGGSSGGSAAAVASGMLTVALGSDTGGSIRQPASFCGVVGFKPTYGVVSRYGVVAFGSSLDQVGPFGRSVADVALTTDAMCGHDVRDSTSQNIDPTYYKSVLAGQREGIKGMRVGVVSEYLNAPGVTAEVTAAFKEALQRVEDLGAHIVELELPHAKAALSAYYVIGPCEAFSNLSRFDSIRYGYCVPDATTMTEQYERSRAEGFGPEVIRRILLGTYLLSSGVYDTYYYPAQQVRTLITQDYHSAFEQVDVLLTPTSPRTAFAVGEVSDPTTMYLSDIFTIPINIAGNGGLSLPIGLGLDSGMPVGLQIIGPQFKDSNIMRVAAALEATYDIPRLAPLVQELSNTPGGDAR
ncbi:MAG: Asp-tRNA(Asn)/Glu-tRNA(Gln) amidotransferase subunit GatA [Coriobacteriales bacterium]|jgi:aspartyl-tRNA(Asn)/glutamyl-tRNA(Gln) amidotransferase subunit A|nr:Asp-tRNA(Asn)/Glu-tRNA(Gln) amidotransferase subunit GatA [Coriobacteriales bacterium]